jgi:hypothetical protein
VSSIDSLASKFAVRRQVARDVAQLPGHLGEVRRGDDPLLVVTRVDQRRRGDGQTIAVHRQARRLLEGRNLGRGQRAELLPDTIEGPQRDADGQRGHNHDGAEAEDHFLPHADPRHPERWLGLGEDGEIERHDGLLDG